MDDFLHNLRSGKLKQHDRGRRDHSDYKGPQRRAGNDRRRMDYYTKVTNENFAMVKDSLGQVTEAQKRVGEALTAMDKTGTRIADALEKLIDLLGSKNDFEKPREGNADTVEEPVRVEENADQQAADEIAEEISVSPAGKTRLSDGDKPGMIEIIASMRNEKKSWEKIAQHISELNIPTVSGKGKWRGQAIKKFYDANS
jgi:hypothetical protein